MRHIPSNDNDTLSPDHLSTLARGTGIAFSGNIVGKAAQVVTQVVLARLLGPRDFGLYALGLTFLRITGALSPLGLGLGVIRYASLYKEKDKARLKGVILQSLWTATAMGLLLGGMLFLAAPYLADRVFHKPGLEAVLRWFSFAIWLAAGLRVGSATTRSTQRMEYSVITQNILLPLSHLVLVILLLKVFQAGMQGALAARVTSFALAFFLALFFIRRLFPEVFSHAVRAKYTFREVLAFSLATAWAGVLNSLASWTDRLLIGYFRPAADVGFYQASAQIATLFSIIAITLNTIVSPMIANMYGNEEKQQLNALFKVTTRWRLNLGLPLLIPVMVNARDIMASIFGEAYLAGTGAMVILASAQVLNLGLGAVGLTLVMTGNQNRWLGITVISLVANITLNLVLIPRFGLIGAAFSTAAAFLFSGVFGLITLFRRERLWPHDKRIFKGLFAGVVTTGILLLLKHTVQFHGRLDILIHLFASLISFGGIILLLGLDEEERHLIGWIRSRFYQMFKVR